jgi:hypothetical protein
VLRRGLRPGLAKVGGWARSKRERGGGLGRAARWRGAARGETRTWPGVGSGRLRLGGSVACGLVGDACAWWLAWRRSGGLDGGGTSGSQEAALGRVAVAGRAGAMQDLGGVRLEGRGGRAAMRWSRWRGGLLFGVLAQRRELRSEFCGRRRSMRKYAGVDLGTGRL